MWYMHDGATAHFRCVVRDVLNKAYNNRCIGTGRPIAWPPSSLDLNSVNFFLLGHLKTIMYAAPVDNEEAFHHRIVDACQTIRNYPGVLNICGGTCIESHGGHFQHLF
jgi:hypothetical protein